MNRALAWIRMREILLDTDETIEGLTDTDDLISLLAELGRLFREIDTFVSGDGGKP